MLDGLESVGVTGILVVDLAIGMIFAVLVFSLAASALYEAIAGVLNYRGTHLAHGIERLLGHGPGDQAARDFARTVMAHPLIEGLKGPKSMLQRLAEWMTLAETRGDTSRLPSAIPSDVFARALLETLVFREHGARPLPEGVRTRVADTLETARKHADGLALDKVTRQRIAALIDTFEETAGAVSGRVDAEIDALQATLAQWFDRSMERVSGWYVRRTKTMLFVLGVALAGASNFDIIAYSSTMVRDEAFRSAIVAEAGTAAQSGRVGAFEIAQAADKDGNGTVDPDEFQALQAVGTQASAGLTAIRALAPDGEPVLGWANPPDTLTGLARMVISWLVIGLGCTMGGQFWFDLLSRALKVRVASAGALAAVSGNAKDHA